MVIGALVRVCVILNNKIIIIIIIKFFTVNTVKVTILDVIIQIGMKIELRY